MRAAGTAAVGDRLISPVRFFAVGANRATLGDSARRLVIGTTGRSRDAQGQNVAA